MLFGLIEEVIRGLAEVLWGEVPRVTGYALVRVYEYPDREIVAVRYEGYRQSEVNSALSRLGCERRDYGPGGEDVRVCEDVPWGRVVAAIARVNGKAWTEVELYRVGYGGEASLAGMRVGEAREVAGVPQYA